MTAHLLGSASWSLAGLVVGYILGRAGRVAVVDAPRRRRVHLDRSTVFGVLILALLGLTVGISLRTAAADRASARCLADAIASRSTASHEGTVAQLGFLRAVRDPGVTQAQRDAALDNYLIKLAGIDQAQQANPVGPGSCE